MDRIRNDCSRFCNSFETCSACPVQPTPDGCCVICAVAMIDQDFESSIGKVMVWAKEHPEMESPHTYADVYFDALPTASFNAVGACRMPVVCRDEVFNFGREGATPYQCHKYKSCMECWNEPAPYSLYENKEV